MQPWRETSALLHCTVPRAHLWFQPHLCMCTTHRPLVPKLPQSLPGWTPSWCPREARGERWPCCLHFNNAASRLWLCSLPLWAFLVMASSLSSPQALSPQPTAVPSTGLFLNPTVSAPVCTSRHRSKYGANRALAQTISASLTLSCLPQPGCCTLLQDPKLPSVPADLPTSKRASQVWEPLLSFSSPPSYAGSFLTLFSVWGLLLVFSRHSARLLSICRCILDAFVRKVEFHILLILHHLDPPL